MAVAAVQLVKTMSMVSFIAIGSTFVHSASASTTNHIVNGTP